jgi:hypothetical protein
MHLESYLCLSIRQCLEQYLKFKYPVIILINGIRATSFTVFIFGFIQIILSLLIPIGGYLALVISSQKNHNKTTGNASSQPF